jgi:hypothetical protein
VPADVLAAQRRADGLAAERKAARRRQRKAEKWKVRFEKEEVEEGEPENATGRGTAAAGGAAGVPQWATSDVTLRPPEGEEASSSAFDTSLEVRARP